MLLPCTFVGGCYCLVDGPQLLSVEVRQWWGISPLGITLVTGDGITIIYPCCNIMTCSMSVIFTCAVVPPLFCGHFAGCLGLRWRSRKDQTVHFAIGTVATQAISNYGPHVPLEWAYQLVVFALLQDVPDTFWCGPVRASMGFGLLCAAVLVVATMSSCPHDRRSGQTVNHATDLARL